MEQQQQEEDEGEEGEEEEAPEEDGEPEGQEDTADSGAEPSPAEASTDSTSDTDAADAGNERGLPVTSTPWSTERRGDRSRERLAWRCVEAARAAASLVPPLTAHALLPAAGLRLPHSCAPAVRVPAGDRRSYNARGGGGAAGRPLTVAMVALRDIPAGAPLSCSWVDAQEPFATRMSRLREYSKVEVVLPAPSTAAGPGGSGGALEPGGAGSFGGCGCPKCFVEGHDIGGCGEGEGGSGLGAERLLKAARLAVDEDR